MEFVKRTTLPEYGNKYYNTKSNGGVNECIVGKPTQKGLNVLCNCVGYAWGRAYESWNTRPKLSRDNAENWFDYNDGYSRGQTPKIGAIVCWQKGKAHNSSDGAGHVAFVEEVKPNGDILVSESGYGSFAFRTSIYTKSSGYLNKLNSKYKLQGFIYSPVDFDNNEPTPIEPTPIEPKKSIDEIAKDVINGKYGNYPERKINLEKEGYNYNEVQQRVNEILSNKPKSNEEYYTIKKGDTLSGIAKKYKTTVKNLMSLNSKIKDKNKIYAGDTIRVK